MKKIFTLMFALTAVIAVNAVQVEFDFTNPTALGITPSADKSTGVELPTAGVVVDPVTLTSTTVQKNPNVLFTKSDGASYELRTYNQNTITFTSTGDKITAVEFAGSDVKYAEVTGKSWTNAEGVASVTFTGNGTSKITKIVLTLGEAPVVWTPDTIGVSEAIALVGEGDAHDHYVKGVVYSRPFITYETFNGKASFWLSDIENANDTIELYDGLGLAGAKWESLEAAKAALHIGDTVLVYAGGLAAFKNFFEITGGNYAEMLGKNPNPPVDPDEPVLPEGVVNCATAVAAAANLADPTADNKTVKGEALKVRGYVSYAYNAADGKQSAWITDVKGSSKGMLQGSYLQLVGDAVVKEDYVELDGTLAKYYKVGKDGNPDEIIIEVIDGTIAKVTQGIENIVLTEKAQKVMVDGVVYIVRDNKMFNLQGAQVR